MPTSGKPKEAAPGDKVAVIEEFESGEGTYLDDWAVRARALGRTLYDLKRRVVAVKPTRPMERIPSPGNEVIGQVETAQANVINLKILYINGEKSQADFTGMVMPRPTGFGGRGRRRPTICRPGDLIKAKVASNVNAIIHLSIDEDSYGVVHTVCTICGGSVAKNNSRVKCGQCGFVDERKLAPDFGKITLT